MPGWRLRRAIEPQSLGDVGHHGRQTRRGPERGTRCPRLRAGVVRPSRGRTHLQPQSRRVCRRPGRPARGASGISHHKQCRAAPERTTELPGPQRGHRGHSAGPRCGRLQQRRRRVHQLCRGRAPDRPRQARRSVAGRTVAHRCPARVPGGQGQGRDAAQAAPFRRHRQRSPTPACRGRTRTGPGGCGARR